MLQIIQGDFNDPRVLELLHVHATRARAETAPGSAHALDLGGLQTPDVRFWTIWDDAALAGFCALKWLSAEHAEIKSMHVAETVRGRGVGGAMLRHLVDTARGEGATRLSLETGAWDYFQPARALYRRHGFLECAPFGDYRADPHSVFMSLHVTGVTGG